MKDFFSKSLYYLRKVLRKRIPSQTKRLCLPSHLGNGPFPSSSFHTSTPVAFVADIATHDAILPLLLHAPSLSPSHIHSTQHVLLSAISSSIAAANGVVGEKEGRREGRRSDLLLLPEMNRQIRGLTWLRYSFGSLTQWVTNSWYHPQQILPHFFTYDIRAQCRLYIWFGSGLLEELYHI